MAAPAGTYLATGGDSSKLKVSRRKPVRPLETMLTGTRIMGSAPVATPTRPTACSVASTCSFTRSLGYCYTLEPLRRILGHRPGTDSPQLLVLGVSSGGNHGVRIRKC